MRSYDLVLDANKLKIYSENFYLPPHRWSAHKDSYKYAWTKVQFKKANASSVPDEPGLYCFVVRPECAALNEIGYLMYIGEAGHDSNNTLRKRFKSYFSEQEHVKRPYISYLLQNWKDYLHFYHCKIDKTKQHLIRKYETELLGTFVPVYNKKDFPASLAKAVKALR